MATVGADIGGLTIAIGVLGAVFAGFYWANLRSRNRVSARERENEAHADFRPSSDSSDPECPRCHGRGVAGFPPATCGLCHGNRHVRFGPDG